ncbi:MAG: glycosyltransferase family 4 protein [Desulfobaccales bacterium]
MPTVALIGPELFPIPPVRGGATELFVDRLAAHLSRYRPLVIGIGDPDLPRQENRDGIDYQRVVLNPWERWLYRRYRHLFPLYDRRVAALIRRLAPDILHVHNRPLLALNLKTWFPGLPVLLHLHNTYDILGKRERPAPHTPLPVDALVACSTFVLEQERQRLGTGAGGYVVIPNGVDPAMFRPRWDRQAEAQAVRQEFGLGDEPVVLYAGKIRESKGVAVLLAAMQRVWEKLPNAVLALVGGTEFGRGRLNRQTPFFRQLREQAARAPGRLLFTGFVPHADMARTYLLGDVFAAPSQKPEGMPLVLLEAAACGLPIISTRLGGIPEVVADRENGLLLDNPHDPEDLAEKILALLADPELRLRLGSRARRVIEERFSWEHIAQQQEAVYDEVVHGFREEGWGSRGSPTVPPDPPPNPQVPGTRASCL